VLQWPGETLRVLNGPAGWTRDGTALRLPPGRSLPTVWNAETLSGLLYELELDATAERMLAKGDTYYLLLSDGASEELAMVYDHGDARSVYMYRRVPAPDDGDRRPAARAALSSKRVAVVGCGSAGSKIAASLARSGVRAFTLVDEDVFFPGNLVRNELDWRAVGAQI